ncbi:MAG TPA: DNA repair protein RadA [Candidatus Omnitrophota bacterium]|nr:DNA repair protein RadA [Candidatus Omnitrophota bacterium]
MKAKTFFVCQDCGAQSPRWVGKCPACQSWNSYVEETAAPPAAEGRSRGALTEAPVLLKEVKAGEDPRWLTGIPEFDRVLGGGVVPGSVTLIGGDPGIGKSTLTLQVVCHLGHNGFNVLYVSGEESVKQTKMRADRLKRPLPDSVYIVNQVDLDHIKEHIKQLKPQVIVIDSIQVVYTPELGSSPGTVAQVRECASILTHMAKALGIALFIIGHVTKEGMIAGPRVLEHIVDTVLYFEGERYTTYRVLRTVKNRFGSTNELGVFEMTVEGLKEVLNPSEIFLAERPSHASGSVVVPVLEGTRPFLVEVQGLVSRSNFGMARHKTQGFDTNRLALLTAVLDKRLGLNLQDKDIFLNIVGGFKIMDPAADLGVTLAVASALTDKRVPSDTVVMGEVGLSAEVRSVSQVALRLKEAEKLGFKNCVLPGPNTPVGPPVTGARIKTVPVAHVREALDILIS